MKCQCRYIGKILNDFLPYIKRIVFAGQLVLAFLLINESYNNKWQDKKFILWGCLVQVVCFELYGLSLLVKNYMIFLENTKNPRIKKARAKLLIFDCIVITSAIVLQVIVVDKMVTADTWYLIFLENVVYVYMSILFLLIVVVTNWVKFCVCRGYNSIDYDNNNFYAKLNKFLLNLFFIVLLFQGFYLTLHFRELVETAKQNSATLLQSTNAKAHPETQADWVKFRNTAYIIMNVLYIAILFSIYILYYKKQKDWKKKITVDVACSLSSNMTACDVSFSSNELDTHAEKTSYIFQAFFIIIGSGCIWYGCLHPLEKIQNWYVDNLDPSDRNIVYTGLFFYTFVLCVNLYPKEKDLVQKAVRSLNEPFLESSSPFLSSRHSTHKKNNKFVF